MAKNAEGKRRKRRVKVKGEEEEAREGWRKSKRKEGGETAVCITCCRVTAWGKLREGGRGKTGHIADKLMTIK